MLCGNTRASSVTEYYELTTSFARLLWLGIILDEDKISDANQTQFRNYLQYFSQENRPFFATATLMKALFYSIENPKFSSPFINGINLFICSRVE